MCKAELSQPASQRQVIFLLANRYHTCFQNGDDYLGCFSTGFSHFHRIGGLQWIFYCASVHCWPSYRKNGYPSVTGLEAAWETFLEGRNLFLVIELSPESDFDHPTPKSDIYDHQTIKTRQLLPWIWFQRCFFLYMFLKIIKMWLNIKKFIT